MKHIDEHSLWDFIMDDVETDAAKQKKEHLNACPICQQAYNDQLQFHKTLFQLEEDIPSMGFSSKVIHHFELDLKLEKRVQFWFKFAKIAVITALSIAIGLPLLLMAFQHPTLFIDSQLVYKIVVPLLSVCMVLWLLYALDLLLKRHVKHNIP